MARICTKSFVTNNRGQGWGGGWAGLTNDWPKKKLHGKGTDTRTSRLLVLDLILGNKEPYFLVLWTNVGVTAGYHSSVMLGWLLCLIIFPKMLHLNSIFHFQHLVHEKININITWSLAVLFTFSWKDCKIVCHLYEWIWWLLPDEDWWLEWGDKRDALPTGETSSLRVDLLHKCILYSPGPVLDFLVINGYNRLKNTV